MHTVAIHSKTFVAALAGIICAAGVALAQPAADDTDQVAVSNFLSFLKELEGRGFPGDAAPVTGLDNPRITITLAFEQGQALDPPLIVIDYKDDTRHDPMVNDGIILALGLLLPAELEIMKATALRANEVLQGLFGSCGLDLVDFKLEFGRDAAGRLRIGDEISMDSMRLWDRETGESLDKDLYRQGTGDVLDAYARVADRLGLEK